VKILLVEDEIKALKTLTLGMEELGWLVTPAHNGEEARKILEKDTYDIVVTDIMMPKMSGFELIKFIRESQNSMPILALTALGDTENKVKGLDLGADDYLVKPFEFKELKARIRALHRRINPASGNGNLKYADLFFDVDKHVIKRQGKVIDLTPKEMSLMKYFLENKERVIPKREIAEKVWQIDFDTQTNIIEVYISYLRNKIDKPFESQLIRTHHGLGYMLKK